mgnify:CR=1 FL=1
MLITLPEDLENTIEEMMQGGRYTSPADIIRDGLRLLRDHDTLQDMRRNELRHEIEKGFASVARGEFTEYDRDDVLSIAEDVKAAGRLKREKAREAAK